MHHLQYYGDMYHVQNKGTCTINSKINGTPQRRLLAHFEATFDFSRSEFYLHIITYGYVIMGSKLVMAKKECIASK